MTKQKCLRLEQVLLILEVIGAEAVEFFCELYWPGAPYAASRSAAPPGQTEEQQGELRDVQAQLRGLVRLLVEKRVISDEELRDAVEAAKIWVTRYRPAEPKPAAT